MLKMLGISLIALFCAMGGLMMSSLLKKRVEALKKTQLFLQLLSERIRYTLSPLDDIFKGLSQEPLLSGLDFIPLCDERMARHMPFPEAFRESIQNCRCPLGKRDRMLLEEICSVLGASAVENQLEGMALIKSNLSEQTRLAQEDVDRRSRLYTSLGMLSGAAAVIVLL